MSNKASNQENGLLSGDKNHLSKGKKQQAQASKMKWSSRKEFIISLLGYSLGLTDIWRVPYITYRNGGGAFLIPYIFFMLVCGIPLYFLEIMLSQFSGKGCWKIWDMCPLFRGFGLAFVVINWVVATYSMLHKPWIIEYIIASFHSVLPWSTCNNEWNTPGCVVVAATTYVTNTSLLSETNTSTPLANETAYTSQSSVEEFWNYKVLRMSTGIDDFGVINWKYLLYLLACHGIIFLSLIKSVQSIGKMMYVTAIAPIVLTFVIWIRALTLTGSLDGMKYFITPDFERLARVEVWIEAAFMAFYTLGPAWGGLFMYGSHNRFRDNCFRDSVISTVLTMFYGVFNGLVVFSVIGVLAHQANLPIDKIITSGGFSLGFVAYPQAITYFPLPQLWAVMFFIILLLPGLDSQTILLEPVLCIIEENFPRTIGKRRLPLLIAVTVVTFVVGIPFTSQAGVYMFQLIDWYTATWSVLLIAVMESVLFSWIYGGDRLSRDAKIMLGRELPVVVRVSCAFVTPLVLLISYGLLYCSQGYFPSAAVNSYNAFSRKFLVVVSIFKYKPPRYGSYVYPDYAISIGWCFSMASVVPMVVWMASAIIREKGTIPQRLRKLTTPNKHWNPIEEDVQREFQLSERHHSRSVRRLVRFNLLGKGKLNAERGIEEQMTAYN